MSAENLTIARPYAKAVFEYAVEENNLAQWSSFLSTVKQVCADQRVTNLLKDPRVNREDLLSFFMSVCEKLLTDSIKNFLKMLSEKKRLAVLPGIADQFEVLKSEKEKTIDVDVISFSPLNEQQQSKLTSTLSKRLERNIEINCQVDEDLLGGAIIRAGDFVIDGSVRGKLKRMREEIIH